MISLVLVDFFLTETKSRIQKVLTEFDASFFQAILQWRILEIQFRSVRCVKTRAALHSHPSYTSDYSAWM